MTKITEQEILAIGFEITEQYDHDQFHANRYQKGIIQVEFTYKEQDLICVEMTLQEVNWMPVDIIKLQILDVIFKI